jgi:hypothetical protein
MGKNKKRRWPQDQRRFLTKGAPTIHEGKNGRKEYNDLSKSRRKSTTGCEHWNRDCMAD